MSKFKIFALVAIVALVIAVPLVAVNAGKKAQENVYIGPGEIINHNLYKAGGSVVIEGEINGDVFVVGSMITIRGPVAGSIFAAGSNVSVSGKIGGSVKMAGSSVTLNSLVAKNAHLLGSSVVIDKDASVGWDLFAGGASIGVSGVVGRHADLSGEAITINNQIGGDVSVYLDREGHAELMPNAKIFGNLVQKSNSEDQLTLRGDAQVLGETTFEEAGSVVGPEAKIKGKIKVLAPAIASVVMLLKIAMLIGLIIVGVIMVAVLPKPVRRVSQKMLKKPWPSLGWGLVMLIVVPVVAVILMITIIGLPLGILTLLVYVMALYLAKVFVSVVIGAVVLRLFSKKKEPNLYWSVIIGAIIFALLMMIPIIGQVICFVATIWALGAMMMVKKRAIKELNQ